MNQLSAGIEYLLNAFAEFTNDPMLIIDWEYNIIAANEASQKTFQLKKLPTNLTEYFDQELIEEFYQVLNRLKVSGTKELIENILINLSKDKSFNTNLIFNKLTFEDNNFVTILFNVTTEINSKNIISEIEIVEDASRKFSSELNTFLQQITDLLPFTLVGKSKAQALANKLSEPIWIKDLTGVYVFVNKAYSDIIGLPYSEIEDKETDYLFFPYQKDLISRSTEYSVKSRKLIRLKGLRIKSSFSELDSEYFILPLKDRLDRVNYTLNILISHSPNDNKAIESANGIWANIPVPLLATDINGKILHSNVEFRKLLGEENTVLTGKNFADVLPYLLVENIKSFVESGLKTDEILVDYDFNPVDDENAEYKFHVNKIFSERGDITSLSIFTERLEKLDDLQKVIKRRGRMFDILIQNNPQPIFIYDKENLRFLEVNEAAKKLYGYNREEFLQMDLTDLYSPEDIQTLLESFGDDTKDGEFIKPFRHKKKDGSTIFVKISKTSFKFNDKEAHFNIVKEITGDLELKKQNQIFQAVFQNASDLALITDAAGFIKYINDSVKKVLGYTSDQLLNAAFASLTRDEDRGMVNSSIFQSQIKDTVSIKLDIKTFSGELIESEIKATPVMDFDGETDSFAIVVKLSQQQVENFEPREIVKEVIKEVIVEKPVDYKTAEKAPDVNFLSGVFHELLTPLNVIFGFSQEIIESLEKPTEEQKEASDIINQNRVKLLDTMNSVIEYSEILQNKSKLNVSKVQITEIIDNIDNTIKEITGTNDIQFGYGKISSSLLFNTDKEKFERMISGLVKIVSRLTREKKIYFSAYSLDADKFIVSLSDQYGAISDYLANILEKIFNEGKDPKDFGAPKLTTHLTKFFITLLGGEFTKQLNYTGRVECGFMFNIEFTPKEKVEQQFFTDEKTIETASVDEKTVQEPEEIESIDTANPEETEDSSSAVEEVSSLSSQIDVNEDLSDKSEQETIFENQKVKEEIPVKPETASELTEISKELDKELEEFSAEMKQEKQEILSKETEAKKPSISAVDLTKLSCLYIEDQVDSQILFKVQMKGLKDVKFAVSFEEALPILDKVLFDFIVIDINLQGEYNGLDALKFIHKMPGFEKIPIIAVTAYVLPGDKEKFIAAGFNDFIAKPIFREKMLESLEKIFLSKS